MQTQLDALTQTVNQIQERLDKVETRLENRNERKEKLDSNCNEREEHGLFIPYQRRNVQEPNDQHLKSIKLDVLTFDGHLDPQLFLASTHGQIFHIVPKVKFVAMKLTGQASQYCINMELMRAS